MPGKSRHCSLRAIYMAETETLMRGGGHHELVYALAMAESDIGCCEIYFPSVRTSAGHVHVIKTYCLSPRTT